MFGAAEETVVLNLMTFALSGDAVFTLQGTATTKFIINVTKQFSLADNAQINLSGVQWSDAIFNIRGPGKPVVLSGNAILAGVLVANDRTVRLEDNSAVNGAVTAGRLTLKGLGQGSPPAVTSP